MLYYLSGQCPLQKEEIKSTQSTQSSDEAHDLETGRARIDSRRQESSSWFTRRIRQVFKNGEAANPSHIGVTTNLIPMVIMA